jgi:hypothetical protein
MVRDEEVNPIVNHQFALFYKHDMSFDPHWLSLYQLYCSHPRNIEIQQEHGSAQQHRTTLFIKTLVYIRRLEYIQSSPNQIWREHVWRSRIRVNACSKHVAQVCGFYYIYYLCDCPIYNY